MDHIFCRIIFNYIIFLLVLLPINFPTDILPYKPNDGDNKTTTTTIKYFILSTRGNLYEPKENHTESITWIIFLHSFLSSNMSLFKSLTFVYFHIISIHISSVFASRF